MSEQKIHLGIKVGKDLMVELKEYAEKIDRSLSWTVRSAIKKLLEEEKKNRMYVEGCDGYFSVDPNLLEKEKKDE